MRLMTNRQKRAGVFHPCDMTGIRHFSPEAAETGMAQARIMADSHGQP